MKREISLDAQGKTLVYNETIKKHFTNTSKKKRRNNYG